MIGLKKTMSYFSKNPLKMAFINDFLHLKIHLNI